MDRETRTRRICETVAQIPPGRVASYGQVAELAGVPRGARQVSRALRAAPAGVELPWHRVLRADGSIAFGRDSRAFALQRERLIIDGVVVSGGRVDMQRYRWRPDLDELLWKPAPFWDES